MKLNKKNILIVGGTGFIGFHLAKACLKKNFNVFSLSISKPKQKRFLVNVKYLFGNIKNYNNLKVLDKFNFDYVVNSGGYVDHINKKGTYEAHFNGSINLYNYFQKKKIKSFIQLGSSAEYGQCKSPINEKLIPEPTEVYGQSKLLTTSFLLKKNKENGFPVIILRFFQLYGPNQDNNRFIPFVINNCIDNNNFDCSPCTQKRDFLFIDDAINSIIIAMKSKIMGQIFNVGYGKPIVLKKIISKIIKIVKKGKPNFGRIKLRIDESKIIFPDVKKIKKILKWKPKTTFSNGLTKTIKFYK